VNLQLRDRVMQRATIKTCVRTGFQTCLLTCFLTGSTGTAFAVDGVVLIDQARALAGNVTPGDAPGFPVTLTLPGSYRLSGNLTVPVQVDGIVIQSSEITLDLNGFRISAPETSDDFAGITDKRAVYRAILIRNGTMTNFGVEMHSHQVEVREMRISKARFAIEIQGDEAVVTRNNVADNLIGLRIEGRDATISHNMASRNGYGIVTSNTAALITRNNTSFNSHSGINAGCPANVVGNIAANNQVHDIFLGPDPLSRCTHASNNPIPDVIGSGTP
jgi:hypothetical protein